MQPPSPDPLAETVYERVLASADTASQETEGTSEKAHPKGVGVLPAPDEGKEAVRVSRPSVGSGWYNHGGVFR